MALPTGTISLSQVNVELDRNATATINLDDADVRSLAERVSGVISMSDLQGKSALFKLVISSNTTNVNLRTLAIDSGWNETSEAEITIDSGVVVSGTTQANSTAALTIDGEWPQGITLINNGVIQGRGGNGGGGGPADASTMVPPGAPIAFIQPSLSNGGAGAAGGRALLVNTPVSIENNGSIRGGGGGGGGGATGIVFSPGPTDRPNYVGAGGGGGGGGGRSGNTYSNGGPSASVSGAVTNGGNGGAGTLPSAGGGGGGGNRGVSVPGGYTLFATGGAGGPGGVFGGSGSGGTPTVAGGFGANGGGGGAAGQAVSGNPSITWLATGTRTGPIV